MIDNPPCAICGGLEWEVVGQRTYSTAMMAGASSYVRRRLEVLFEIWCPGKDEVTLRSQLCRRCGFVGYAPRPTEENIDRKYRFLTSLSPETEIDSSSEIERTRAQRVYRSLAKRLPTRRCSILDFGGGDGRLMSPLLEKGHECSVVDYVPTTLPGIQRVGTILEDLPPDQQFDAVICSHVMEHVAEPARILSRLRNHLSDHGTIYVEVPMEVWCQPPLHNEPVTHVNFFTERSLEILLAECRFVNIDVRLVAYQKAPGKTVVAVVGVANREGDRTVPPRMRGAADATRALLKPNRWLQLRRALLTPKDFLRRVTPRAWKRD